MRVDSQVDIGSRFSFLLPFATDNTLSLSSSSSEGSVSHSRAHAHRNDEIDNLVQALSSSHLGTQSPTTQERALRSPSRGTSSPFTDITEHASPRRPPLSTIPEPETKREVSHALVKAQPVTTLKPGPSATVKEDPADPHQLRILVVEVRTSSP